MRYKSSINYFQGFVIGLFSFIIPIAAAQAQNKDAVKSYQISMKVQKAQTEFIEFSLRNFPVTFTPTSHKEPEEYQAIFGEVYSFRVFLRGFISAVKQEDMDKLFVDNHPLTMKVPALIQRYGRFNGEKLVLDLSCGFKHDGIEYYYIRFHYSNTFDDRVTYACVLQQFNGQFKAIYQVPAVLQEIIQICEMLEIKALGCLFAVPGADCPNNIKAGLQEQAWSNKLKHNGSIYIDEWKALKQNGMIPSMFFRDYSKDKKLYTL